jgi:hypothetical protein
MGACSPERLNPLGLIAAFVSYARSHADAPPENAALAITQALQATFPRARRSLNHPAVPARAAALNHVPDRGCNRTWRREESVFEQRAVDYQIFGNHISCRQAIQPRLPAVPASRLPIPRWRTAPCCRRPPRPDPGTGGRRSASGVPEPPLPQGHWPVSP